jgi:PhnB protein
VGVRAVQPHLVFNGDCEAAFRLYERAFGGTELRLVRYGETPMSKAAPADGAEKILHAALRVGDGLLLGVDFFGEDYKPPQGFYVVLSVDDQATASRTFTALSDGGIIVMELQETFWSPWFGIVVDRYGISWEINTEAAPPSG